MQPMHISVWQFFMHNIAHKPKMKPSIFYSVFIKAFSMNWIYCWGVDELKCVEKNQYTCLNEPKQFFFWRNEMLNFRILNWVLLNGNFQAKRMCERYFTIPFSWFNTHTPTRKHTKKLLLQFIFQFYTILSIKLLHCFAITGMLNAFNWSESKPKPCLC